MNSLKAVALSDFGRFYGLIAPHLANLDPNRLMAHADRGQYYQTSVCSAISSASSTSMPRYLTVLSSFV